MQEGRVIHDRPLAPCPRTRLRHGGVMSCLPLRSCIGPPPSSRLGATDSRRSDLRALWTIAGWPRDAHSTHPGIVRGSPSDMHAHKTSHARPVRSCSYSTHALTHGRACCERLFSLSVVMGVRGRAPQTVARPARSLPEVVEGVEVGAK